MEALRILLPQTEFQPGETVAGRVDWHCEQDPVEIELHIGWHTEGRGTEDAHTEFEQRWPVTSTSGSQEFWFQLPPSPYSFQGTLIELIWSIVAESKRGKQHAQVDIVVGPDKRVIML